MRRVFSGIQPTGIPHVGNYFGAISHWVALQNAAANAADSRSMRPERSRHMYCIVDLHAMTSAYDARTFSASCRTTAAILLGCGLDPSKVIVFRQSEVRSTRSAGALRSASCAVARLPGGSCRFGVCRVCLFWSRLGASRADAARGAAPLLVHRFLVARRFASTRSSRGFSAASRRSAGLIA